jgi:hypothetical protein
MVRMDSEASLLKLAFDGPFAWWHAPDARCLFDSPEQHAPGIYLWTVECENVRRVYYVGETGRSFGVRMDEHLRGYLCGAYVLYEPCAFARGEKVVVWPGSLQWRQQERIRMCEFVDRFDELAPTIREFVKQMRFWLAPFPAESHRPRKRIEAALAAALRTNCKDEIDLQDEGIVYEALRWDSEPHIQARIRCQVTIAGLPDLVEA